MKRKQITAILLALVVAASAGGLLTGCVGKTYKYDKDWNLIGEDIEEISTASQAASTPSESSTITPTESSTETPAESSTETPAESSTETPAESSTETPAESSTETPAESSAEASVDENALAVIYFKANPEWTDCYAYVYGKDDVKKDESNAGIQMELTDQATNTYRYVVLKTGYDGKEMLEPRVVFKTKTAGIAPGENQCPEGTGWPVENDKTYSYEDDE